MYPLITFPDIEAWATEWLYDQVIATNYSWSKSVNFNNVIPKDGDRPQYLVVVNRDGGATYEHLDQPRLRINVWAPEENECEEICRVLGGLLLIARTDTTTPVCRAVVNGSVRVPDSTGGARRAFWSTLTTMSK